MAALASKTQSQKIFEKLRTKPANRVRFHNATYTTPRSLTRLLFSYASTADRRIQLGHQFPLESIYASIAPQTTEIWACTFPLCDPQISTVRTRWRLDREIKTDRILEWQWDQLRIMKVGGNESATKFFQSNGGTAALNSKDPTTKYTANAATKYKEELKRRSAKDAAEYEIFTAVKI
jgi:ADP-ribosylation factor GTPase-activating protein 2/3